MVLVFFFFVCFSLQDEALVKPEFPVCTTSLEQEKAAWGGRGLHKIIFFFNPCKMGQRVSTAECIAIGITRRLFKCCIPVFMRIKSLKAAQVRAREKHILALAQSSRREPDVEQGFGTPGVAEDHFGRKRHLSTSPRSVWLWSLLLAQFSLCMLVRVNKAICSLYTQGVPKQRNIDGPKILNSLLMKQNRNSKGAFN